MIEQAEPLLDKIIDNSTNKISYRITKCLMAKFNERTGKSEILAHGRQKREKSFFVSNNACQKSKGAV